jgi:uncharacterized membrane protein
LTIFDAIVLALIWNEYRNGLAAKQR